jgi:hypothetical protein
LLFWGLKYLNSLMRIRDPGSGMETVWIRDPGWIKVWSGIRDKHPGSATLPFTLVPDVLTVTGLLLTAFLLLLATLLLLAYLRILASLF